MNLEHFAPDDTHLKLDEGIRQAVLILRSQGVETFESCQGGDGHAYAEPTVRFHGDAWEGYRAFTTAMQHGLNVGALRRVHVVNDGQLHGPWWELTLRDTKIS